MYKTLLGAILFVVASSAGAQQMTLKQCAEIEDSLERLVCYDNVAKRKHEQPEKSQGKAKGKEIAKTKKEKHQQRIEQRGQSSSEQSFGMEHKAKQEGQLDRIEVEVVSKEKGPYEKWRIELASGQIWKQTDGPGYFPWSGDGTYFIERGALNSFSFGREGSNRRMRVQRVK